MTLTDDLGLPVDRPARITRVVSLVPSLTEAVALTAPGLLVGVTDWCTHPADLDVVRVRGTKNPDVERIVALAPDLVLANEEENRQVDLDLLRAAGLAVYETDIRSVDGALASLPRMLAACDLPRPGWLDAAAAAWDAVRPVEPRRRAAIPIWRRPWMAIGTDTYTGSVLARLGVDNVLADSTERYPRFDPDRLPPADLVVLPDEPYLFTPDDGPEAFPGLPAVCVPGRLLTWYGPAMVEAAQRLPELLRGAARQPGRPGNAAG
jgi:ABC-type Fe3+-hydroxamate transport system substrate-binding protein